jgi:hypothetical protein
MAILAAGCRSSSTSETSSSAAAPAEPRSAASAASSATTSAADAGASASASASSEPEDTTYAKHSAAALVAECIERRSFGYLCNNAYPEAARRFPADAAAIQTLMRLAVRVDAGKPYGGEGEVKSFCQPDKGEGGAYACLYVADGNTTREGKAAHALACKGAPPEGQLPIAGGTAACDGDKPVQIAPLPRGEADQVRRCFACGDPKNVSHRDGLLTDMASAKACVALRKRLGAREATFIEQSIEPLCPAGS